VVANCDLEAETNAGGQYASIQPCPAETHDPP
jgi:hypothetical protein